MTTLASRAAKLWDLTSCIWTSLLASLDIILSDAFERSVKTMRNPPDADGMPRYLLGGSTQYVLHNFASKSSPYRLTEDSVSVPLGPIHHLVCYRGGTFTVLCEAHLLGFIIISWKREINFQYSSQAVLLKLAVLPNQQLQASRLYRHMRIGSVLRELTHVKSPCTIDDDPVIFETLFCHSTRTSGGKLKIGFSGLARFKYWSLDKGTTSSAF